MPNRERRALMGALVLSATLLIPAPAPTARAAYAGHPPLVAAPARVPSPAGASSPVATDPRDTAFSVVLTTAMPVTAVVHFGASPAALTQTAYDDRDAPLQAAGVSSTIHRFTLGPLSPDTTYYYQPVIGGVAETNTADPSGVFSYTTTNFGAQLPPLPTIVFGDVHRADNLPPPANTVLLIVTLSTPGAGGSVSEPLSLITTTASSTQANASYAQGTSAVVSRNPTTGAYTTYGVIAGSTVATVVGFADIGGALVAGGPVSAVSHPQFGYFAEPLLTFVSPSTAPPPTPAVTAAAPPPSSTAPPAATATASMPAVPAPAATSTPSGPLPSPTLAPTLSPVAVVIPTLTAQPPAPTATSVGPGATPSATTSPVETAPAARPPAPRPAPSMVVTVLSVDGAKPSSSVPTVRLGSIVTWTVSLRSRGGALDMTAAFNPALQDVLASNPPSGFVGNRVAWNAVVVPAGYTRLLMLTTRIRGQAGCGARVPLTVTLAGAASTATVRVSCPPRQVVRHAASIAAMPAGAVRVVSGRGGMLSGSGRAAGASGAAVTQRISLIAPPHALTQTATLVMSRIVAPLRATLVTTRTQMVNFNMGAAFGLVVRGPKGLPITSFDQPLTLCLSYAGLSLAGLNPLKVRIAAYDPVTENVVALPSVVRLPAAMVCAAILHDGIYVLTAELSPARALMAVATEVRAQVERLLIGQRADASARRLRLGIASLIQSTLSSRARALTHAAAFVAPATVTSGQKIVTGVSSSGSGEPVLFEFHYAQGPIQRVASTTDQQGVALIVATVPPSKVSRAQQAATLRVTLTRLDGTREAQMVRFTVLRARPPR